MQDCKQNKEGFQLSPAQIQQVLDRMDYWKQKYYNNDNDCGEQDIVDALRVVADYICISEPAILLTQAEIRTDSRMYHATENNVRKIEDVQLKNPDTSNSVLTIEIEVNRETEDLDLIDNIDFELSSKVLASRFYFACGRYYKIFRNCPSFPFEHYAYPNDNLLFRRIIEESDFRYNSNIMIFGNLDFKSQYAFDNKYLQFINYLYCNYLKDFSLSQRHIFWLYDAIRGLGFILDEPENDILNALLLLSTLNIDITLNNAKTFSLNSIYIEEDLKSYNFFKHKFKIDGNNFEFWTDFAPNSDGLLIKARESKYISLRNQHSANNNFATVNYGDAVRIPPIPFDLSDINSKDFSALIDINDYDTEQNVLIASNSLRKFFKHNFHLNRTNFNVLQDFSLQNIMRLFDVIDVDNQFILFRIESDEELKLCFADHQEKQMIIFPEKVRKSLFSVKEAKEYYVNHFLEQKTVKYKLFAVQDDCGDVFVDFGEELRLSLIANPNTKRCKILPDYIQIFSQKEYLNPSKTNYTIENIHTIENIQKSIGFSMKKQGPFVFIDSFKIELLFEQASNILNHLTNLRDRFCKPNLSMEDTTTEVQKSLERLASLLGINNIKIVNQAERNELLSLVKQGNSMLLQKSGDRFRSNLKSHNSFLMQHDFCSHSIEKVDTDEEYPLNHSDLDIDYKIKIDGKTVEQTAGRYLVLTHEYILSSRGSTDELHDSVDLDHIFTDVYTDLLTHLMYTGGSKRNDIEDAISAIESDEHIRSHAFLEFLYSNMSYSVNMFLVRLWMYDALLRYVVNVDSKTSEIISLLTEIYLYCDYVWYDKNDTFQFMLRDPKNFPKNNYNNCKFSINFQEGMPPLEFESVLGAWNTNSIPGWILSDNHKMVAKQILKVSNVTTRDLLIRYFGYERFLQNLDLDIVDTQDDYQLGLLYLVDGSDTRTLPYLIMVNPTTGERHIEGVEPRIRTVEEALNWRLGLTVYDRPVFEA